ncbi:hypothetical protein EPO15_16950 [bacterium]|nr:MAG: hypothetical protein EPO15_16950 [bacterium]
MPRPKSRRARQYSLTALHRNMGALLKKAENFNAALAPGGSIMASAMAKDAIAQALEQWMRIQGRGLVGTAKLQAMGDINEYLERRGLAIDRHIAAHREFAWPSTATPSPR